MGRQLFCLVGVCALCPAEYGHGTNANALKPAHTPQAARANDGKCAEATLAQCAAAWQRRRTSYRLNRSARVALRRTLRLALHATARRVAAVYYCTVRRRRVCRAARSIGGGSYWLPVAQRLEPLKVAPALRLHRSAVWLGMPQKTAAMR